MRKIRFTKILPALSLFILFTFTACNNVFENNVSSEEEHHSSSQADKKKQAKKDPATGEATSSDLPETIQFGGFLQLNGAVPAEFVQSEASSDIQQNNRSANAQIPDGTDYEYYITATSNDGIVHEGKINVNPGSEVGYTLELEVRKTWSFTAGFRKKAQGTPGTNSYVAPKNLLLDVDTDSGHPYTLTLSDAVLKSAEPKIFFLKPLQTSGGKGTVNLQMEDPSSLGITDLKLFTSGANGALQVWNPSSNIEVSLTSIKTKSGKAIPSGSYNVTMVFYSGSFQVYIAYQTINVFDNMETKIWSSGKASGAESIINGTTFCLTSELVQKFTSSSIYVGAPEGITIAPNDERNGSPYAPLEHLSQAFSIIQANKSGDGDTRDYRILVTTAKPTPDKVAQPQRANLTIPDTITSSNAKSIEIIGLGTGNNQATLNPDSANAGTVLTVNTTVPVKLSNIKITGGAGSSGKGGALSITKNGAKVTLESGTVITGNSANSLGGGIYIQGTDSANKPELIINNGAEITENFIGDTGIGGMAIYADCAKVTMNGGEISHNSKSGGHYGAVRLTNDSDFTITAGIVADNDGCAFYVDSTYDVAASTYTHSTLTIGGTAEIPYGVSGTTGQNKNDIFVKHVGPDGGKYSPVCIKTDDFNLPSSSKIALTPDSWQRGLAILEADSGDIDNYKNYFTLTDTDFNFRKSTGDEKFAKLKAPIYVKENGVDNNSASGTRAAPYKTLEYAVNQLAGGEPDLIKILGKLNTAQSIPDGFDSTRCSELTIKGEIDTEYPDVLPGIDANGSNSSALLLDTDVPVIIQDLKLTGGKGTPGSQYTYGGGIYLKKGSLSLADGALITGNTAQYGGGVYVYTGAKLFMYGTALIGDSVDTLATSQTDCANYASVDGGGIYSLGLVYLGYKNDSGNLVPESLTGGVKRNLAKKGGGINNQGASDTQKALLKIASGYVSYNKTVNSIGGGIYNYRADIEISNGEISYNEANHGGGILIGETVSADFSGGIIKENKADTNGGGIYVFDYASSSFTMSGSASIPYGVTVNGSLVKSAGKNDVFLNSIVDASGNIQSNAVIKIGDSLSANGTRATITLANWKRGTQFLGTGGSLTQLTDTIIGKFDFTDLGWDKKKYTQTIANDAAKIDADIYVAGTSPVRCKTSSGARAPTDTDNTKGTWAHPFATISAATAFVDAGHDSIIIDGTIGAQTITGTGSIAAMTIKGYKSGSTSSAKINGGFSSTNPGTSLTINTSNLINIEDLEITGGYSNSDGGGIKLVLNSNAKVNLGSGVVVRGNYAKDNGGGVYICGNGKLAMSYNAVIGNSGANGASQSNTALSTGINKSACGGGICNKGNCYLGARLNADGTVDSSASNGGGSAFTGGVYANVATTSGGGFYIMGPVTLYSGNVKYNYATTSGGGAYIASAKSLTVENAAFELNKTGSLGGAVYNGGTFNVKGNANLYASTNAEKTNDVYLASEKNITVTDTITNSGTVATVTPDKFKRGREIISAASSITIDKSKFKLSQDDDGWNKENKTVSSNNYVYINSPIYVAGSTGRGLCSAPPESGANGIKTKPFASIQAAINSDIMDSNTTDYTITVDGIVTANHQIPNTLTNESTGTCKAGSLTITGYKATDTSASTGVLKGNGSSALTINAAVASFPIIITNLKITGGSDANGAGINLTSGKLTLTDGAIITGNTATGNGGGVYVNTNGTLLMYGKSLIGDDANPSTPTTATSSSGGYANKAKNGAGIYVAGGNAYLGYETTSSTRALVTDSSYGYFGVRHNYATQHGGGIYYSSGTLKIASGYVAYNLADTNAGGIYFANGTTLDGGYIKGNQAVRGGALYIAASKEVILKSVSLTNNKVYSTTTSTLGGAVYNAGTLKMQSATDVSNNTAEINGYASQGGAFYNATNAEINISGAVRINNNSASYGGAFFNYGTIVLSNGTVGTSTMNTAKQSGGAVYQNGTLKVSGSAKIYNAEQSENKNDVYLTGTAKYVTLDASLNTSGNTSSEPMMITPSAWHRGDKVLDGSSYIGGNYTKFKISDAEWSINTYGTGSNTAGIINAEIWVAGKGKNGNSVALSSGVGTTSDPSDSNRGTKKQPYASLKKAVEQCWDSSGTFTIKIDGTLYGAEQIIPEAVNTDTVKTGLASEISLEGNGNGPTIDRGLTGGTASTSGSALTINSTNLVTIGGITITGGNKTGNGGGLNITASGAKVNLNATQIRQNKASEYGGGVYIASGATLCLYANASIGKGNSPSLPSAVTLEPTTSNYLNKARLGGGIYCEGTLAIAKVAAANGNLNTATSAAPGINGNIATEQGGGLYLTSTAALNMDTTLSYTFSISKNLSGADGGGITNEATATLTNTSLQGNRATNYGGAIKNNGNLTLGSNCNIGNYNVNNAGVGGGAILQRSNKLLMTSSATVADGGSKTVNDVYIYDEEKLNIESSWTGSLSLTPYLYDASTIWLRSDTNAVDTKYTQVNVTPNDTVRWMSTSAGKLEKGQRMNMSYWNTTEIQSVVSSLASGSKIEITGSLSSGQWDALEQGLMSLYAEDNSKRVTLDLSNSSITSVPEGAFNTAGNSTGGCMALTSVILPSSCTSISDSAFYGCGNLTSISGIDNVTSIGNSAFGGCQFASFPWPSGLAVISDNMFWSCTQLGDLVIPDGITTIGKGAFSCAGLTSVRIPDTVTSIGESAFNYCNFETVSIPTNPNLTVIEKSTFYNCYNLVSVTIPSNIQKVYCTAFHAFEPENQKLTSITFQTTSGWKDSKTGNSYNVTNASANVEKLTQYNVNDYLYR